MWFHAHWQTSYMFFRATAFNQDLCQFGQYFFQITTLYRMFDNSGCSNTVATPTSATGPWCAATTCPPWHSFTGNGELRTAIKEYLAAGCTDDPKCEARSKYGGAVSHMFVCILATSLYRTCISNMSWLLDSTSDWGLGCVGLEGFPALVQRRWKRDTPLLHHRTRRGIIQRTYQLGYRYVWSNLRRVLSHFNVPSLTHSLAQFYQCLGSATYMYRMFSDLPAFNQPLSLDTSKVTSMGFMFRNATAFNQPLSFDTAKVLGVSVFFS